MKTLREIMDRLPAARRRKVDQRANALIAEERMRQDLPKARARPGKESDRPKNIERLRAGIPENLPADLSSPKVGPLSAQIREVTMRLDPINLYDYEGEGIGRHN